MREITIKLYSFDELSESAKHRAIEDHRRFLLETEMPSDYDTEEEYNERMCYISTNDEYVVENIEVNDYLFFADGELCWSCYYVAGVKAGTLEINVHGEMFTFKEG